MTLLNFRAVARRTFGMHVAVSHAKVMITYDRGLPPLVQREWFAVCHRDLVNAEQALKNIKLLKSRYDVWITSREFAATNALVIHFDGPPDFQCAEIVGMRFDFAGRRLDEPQPPAHLCAYTVSGDHGWVFVLSWLGRNDAAEQLCDSFLKMPDHDKAPAILRYAIEHTDNIFFAPRWWDSLPEDQQRAMAKALTDRLHPHHVTDSQMLMTKPVPPLSAKYRGAEKVGLWSAA